MPQGTPTSSPAHPFLSSARENAITTPPALTPSPRQRATFWVSDFPASAALRLNSTKAHDIARAKREAWAALDLHQDWADAAFMRGHLKVAGLRVRCSDEPATANRIRTKLRGIGVHAPEIQTAIGMPLARFLKVNPKLPLWAALALVLESTGRFTPNDGGGP